MGTVKRSAQTFQSDDEDKLWESNVFNTSTAEGLQNVLTYVSVRYAISMEGRNKEN